MQIQISNSAATFRTARKSVSRAPAPALLGRDALLHEPVKDLPEERCGHGHGHGLSDGAARHPVPAPFDRPLHRLPYGLLVHGLRRPRLRLRPAGPRAPGFVESAFYDPPNEFQAKDMTGNISATYSFAAHAVRVKVDPGTGRVKVLKFVAVHDVGKVINPSGLDGQIHGAIQQGLGYALTENLQVEKGKTLNPSYLDYKMFTFMDMPKDIEIHYVETNDPAGPYGAKGVSEAGIIPIPAAVANAVADATGVRIRSLPISPEKILTAIKTKV